MLTIGKRGGYLVIAAIFIFIFFYSANVFGTPDNNDTCVTAGIVFPPDDMQNDTINRIDDPEDWWKITVSMLGADLHIDSYNHKKFGAQMMVFLFEGTCNGTLNIIDQCVLDHNNRQCSYTEENADPGTYYAKIVHFTPAPEDPDDDYGYDIRAYTEGGSDIPPELSDGVVIPDSGDAVTLFTYYVQYLDTGGDMPTSGRIIIDNTPPAREMTLYSGTEPDPTRGILYKYETYGGNLGAGTHQYSFIFEYGDGYYVTLPQEGNPPFDGPSVDSSPIINISPPSLEITLEAGTSIEMLGGTGKTEFASQHSDSVIVLDIAKDDIDPDTVVSGEIIIRFRAEEAALFHSKRIGIHKKKKAEWIKADKEFGINDLPADIIKIRPLVPGAKRAMRLMEKYTNLKVPISKGLKLNNRKLKLAEQIIKSSLKKNGPMGSLVAKLRPGSNMKKVCMDLMKRKDVIYAHPIPRSSASAIPNDEFYERMWNLERIDLPAAWDISGNTPGEIRVCVVDTGVRIEHTDFIGRTVDPADIYPGNGNAYDDTDPDNDDPDGHGTAVAGIVAATRNNSEGIAGIAPVTIIPVNGAIWNESSERWDIANYTEGVYWCVDHGADIINLSIGGYRDGAWPDEETAAEYAEENGVLVFAAAGNDDSDADTHYPSAIPYYISVGAVDHDDLRVASENWGWGSNHGLTLDICAPGAGNVGNSGDAIITLDRDSNDDYRYNFNGTSAATPHVAGVAALLLHSNPALSATNVREILENTAEDLIGDPNEDTIGWDQYHGYGLVNAESAVSEAARAFRINNNGLSDLIIDSITKENNSNWLSISPDPPFSISQLGGTQKIEVLINTIGLEHGEYSDRLIVSSNDFDQSPYPGAVYVNLSIICNPFEIIDDPDSLSVIQGDNATFTVEASGTELHYQWKINGIATGEDSPTLTLYNVQMIDDGAEIVCEITNGCETISSDLAILSVTKACQSDSDGDGDVDGLDLRDYILDLLGIGLEDFAANFGKVNCP